MLEKKKVCDGRKILTSGIGRRSHVWLADVPHTRSENKITKVQQD